MRFKKSTYNQDTYHLLVHICKKKVFLFLKISSNHTGISKCFFMLQFDDHGVACVLVHDVKKHFYKKFLYEPFPVESSLLQVLPDHLNAEIVAGTITTKQEALDYMTWTFFFRRLVQNPTYYGLDGVNETNINGFLTQIVDKALTTLNE